MNILVIVILLVLLAGQKNGGTGGGAGGGGTPPPETCTDSKFGRMQLYIWGLKRIYGSYVNLLNRNPAVAATLEREYGDCRGWNNW